ncbi:MAG TPA: hypothetical protein VMH01_09095 [Puia sp.]|nr:hypothetical protein [Puia sp.]
MKSNRTKREVVNQLINFFWTILCFAPVLYCWMISGMNLYFYLSLVIAFVVGIMPKKIVDLFLLGSDRKFYEKLGVKKIRKLVQNGDLVRTLGGGQTNQVIKGPSQARHYLKTIAMYERYHWICLAFFLQTTIYSFLKGYFTLGFLIIAANLLYNVSSILLQQYNRIRITKMLERVIHSD